MSKQRSIRRFLDAGEERLLNSVSFEKYISNQYVSFEHAIQSLSNSVVNIQNSVSIVKQKCLKGINHVTKDEAEAIYIYSLTPSKANESVRHELNRALRSGDENTIQPWLPYLNLLLSALRKLPSVQATIYRASTNNEMDKYLKECTWTGVTLCTKNQEDLLGSSIGKDIVTIFRIKCKNGKCLKTLSSYSDENEIILMPGTRFIVSNKKQSPNRQFMVELTEVTAERSSRASLGDDPFTKIEHNPKDQPVDVTAYQHVPKYAHSNKNWLNCQFHQNDNNSIITPEQLQNTLTYPPKMYDEHVLNLIKGSMIGMALGDALGAHVEFRPRDYLIDHPVQDLEAGGTWGLNKGQFTDDTSMALCLANSLIYCRTFDPYDQLVRYKWWYKCGYMSATGSCFDIGSGTREALIEFESRQAELAKKHKISVEELDLVSDKSLLKNFNVFCSKDGGAGNGALMRLAPVPLFFHKNPTQAVHFSGLSGLITHGDRKAVDACRYYGALIVAALRNETKKQLLSDGFYAEHISWFDGKPLAPEIMQIAEGSYRKEGGYDAGIRGKGYIVQALEAALWALWSDNDSFEIGVLNAVNLGDDTDTTAAIYGQLAGALYGYDRLPSKWVKHIYAHQFIVCVSEWIAYEGELWQHDEAFKEAKSNVKPNLPVASGIQKGNVKRQSVLPEKPISTPVRPKRHTTEQRNTDAKSVGVSRRINSNSKPTSKR